MSKDYARYTGKNNNSNKPLNALIVFLVALFVIGSVMWIYTFKLKKDFSRLQLSEFIIKIGQQWHEKFSPKKNPSHNAIASQSVIKQEPEIKFDFYDELQKSQVINVVEEGNAPAKNPAPPIAPEKTHEDRPGPDKIPGFIVKLAVFNNKNEASQVRLSLLLSGIEAEMVNDGNNYRLQQGPFNSLEQAKTIQAKLKRKGIESEILGNNSPL